MDHGGEEARPTTVGCTDDGMAGPVQGGEAHMTSGTFHSQLGAAAARRASCEPTAAAYLLNSAEFARHVRGAVPVAVFHREPGQGVAYANIGVFWRQPGPAGVLLVGPQLAGGVVPVHDNYYGYSALQPRPGAGHGVVIADLLPSGIGGMYSRDYALQPRPGAGQGEVPVDLLPVRDGLGHGEVFVGRLPGGVDTVYDDYGYYALQPCPVAGQGEVPVDLLPVPDGVGHGEVFVSLLPGGVDAAYDNYGYYALQPRSGAGHGEVLVDLLPNGAGHGEVFVDLLPGGGGAVHDPLQHRPGAGRHELVGVVFDNSGNFAQHTLPAIGRTDGTAGMLRDPNLGAGYDGSVALADDLGAVYDNRGMVAEYLRRLLPFVGISASSVAVNGLAAGPGSPAVAFHLFVLLLGGLLLVILHVLRV